MGRRALNANVGAASMSVANALCVRRRRACCTYALDLNAGSSRRRTARAQRSARAGLPSCRLLRRRPSLRRQQTESPVALAGPSGARLDDKRSKREFSVSWSADRQDARQTDRRTIGMALSVALEQHSDLGLELLLSLSARRLLLKPTLFFLEEVLDCTERPTSALPPVE